ALKRSKEPLQNTLHHLELDRVHFWFHQAGMTKRSNLREVLHPCTCTFSTISKCDQKYPDDPFVQPSSFRMIGLLFGHHYSLCLLSTPCRHLFRNKFVFLGIGQ